MKKITLLASAFIVSLGFIGATSSVQAQQVNAGTCNSIVITNTGANSNNNGTCTVVTNVVAKCVNNLYVLDASAQTAVSGAASVVGTVNGGAAISGNAANSNGTTVTLGTSCGSTTGTTTPTTPTTPGTGSTTPTPVAPTAAPKQAVAALPYTAGNETLAIVAAGIALAIAAFVASRFGIAAYRRAQLNK